jgi:hypothetical protein
MLKSHYHQFLCWRIQSYFCLPPSIQRQENMVYFANTIAA